MLNAASDASTRSDGPNDIHDAIVSDLTSLIAQVKASMELIEAAIAMEASPGLQEISADVVVLDDVTPRYVGANVALNDCHSGLGAALHLLTDVMAAKPGMANLIAFGPPVRSNRRA